MKHLCPISRILVDVPLPLVAPSTIFLDIGREVDALLVKKSTID